MSDNMLNRGAAFVAARLKKHCSALVLYQSASAGLFEDVPATIGQTQADSSDTDGLTVRTHTRDYLIDAADLAVDDVPVEPRTGDTITDGLEVYEVLPMPGVGCWRWSDRDHKRRRIHTKWVETLEE